MAGESQKFFTGKGKLWIDDIDYLHVTSVAMTRADDFEDFDDPNGNGKISVGVGSTYTGTVTILKKDNMAVLKKLKNNKNVEEMSMIVKELNKATGNYETTRFVGVVCTEFPLAGFENNTVTKLELPVNIRDYDVLQD